MKEYKAGASPPAKKGSPYSKKKNRKIGWDVFFVCNRVDLRVSSQWTLSVYKISKKSIHMNHTFMIKHQKTNQSYSIYNMCDTNTKILIGDTCRKVFTGTKITKQDDNKCIFCDWECKSGKK